MHIWRCVALQLLTVETCRIWMIAFFNYQGCLLESSKYGKLLQSKVEGNVGSQTCMRGIEPRTVQDVCQEVMRGCMAHSGCRTVFVIAFLAAALYNLS
jgi:hypothetical protein